MGEGDVVPSAAAAASSAASAAAPGHGRKLSHNELEMARQYSETSARISAALERGADGRPITDGKGKGRKGGKASPGDLKKELEMWEHKVTVEELAKRLGTDAEAGLTVEAAAERLARDGPNVLSPPKLTPWWIKLSAQFLNFFALLLQVAGVLCFIGYALEPAGKDNLFLGIVLFVVVIVTAVFSFFQEFKSEKTMEKFKNFLPPKAVVHRGGKVSEIPAVGLVVGDVIEIKLGNQLPADVRLVSNQKLKVDNSPLTGESEPISRTVECTDENPLETKNLAFFGTLAVDGTCTGIVVNTGDDTVFGRIAGLAAGSTSDDTTLQVDIHYFVVLISVVAIFLGVLFFLINIAKKKEWIANIVFCIGMIVANVPEGLLATVTVSLTLAAQRMAKNNVLVKKLEAVETLGSTTVICSDKTGTLTQNRMTIVHLCYDMRVETTRTASTEQTFDAEDPCFKMLFFVGACCGKAVFDANEMEANPDVSVDERKVNGDASEAGILKFSEKLQPVGPFREANAQVMTVPFNSTNKYMITTNKVAGVPGQLRLCMKGAPERVMDRCSTILTASGPTLFDDGAKAVVNEKLQYMMDRGERVLGFAYADLDRDAFPHDFAFDTDEPNFPTDGLVFAGLMALLDPPREAVPEAVRTCQSAGVKVIMVTGDHPATAKSIAMQVDIIRDPTQEDLARERGVAVSEIDPADVKSVVIPGSQIKDLEEEDWDRILAHDQIVFARTSPQQKLIIVENNQRLGHIVAVTGDGVNDSPALKKANVGIAMGISGSDVSKEAADMVLLDDNFASIVHGVLEGRLIFDNLKKSIAYTLTSNMPEIMPFVVYVLIQIPQPLTTVLMLVIDLGMDMLPAISLAYERAETDIMRRPPRDSRVDRLVNRRLIMFSYFQLGAIQALAGLFTYFVVLNDFGWHASGLPGVDKDNYVASVRAADKRWMYTKRRDLTAEPFGSVEWFTDAPKFEAAFGGKVPEKGRFDRFIPADAANEAVDQPTAEKGANFEKMVRTIGSVEKRPMCVPFSCKVGGVAKENDMACFEDPSVVGVSVKSADLLKGTVRNPNIKSGAGPGEGCIDLWSVSQQTETLKHAQTAYLASIVIVQAGGLLVCRTRVLSIFTQSLFNNRLLFIGLLSDFVLLCILFYAPPVAKVFDTRPIRAVHWLPGVPFAIFIFVYDELRKFGIRYGDRTGNKFGRWLRRETYW
jgi:sodium/potassium-transporting ATPase subunit alpha